MEKSQPISFRVVRDFSGILSATFIFVRHNFMPLLRFYLVLVGPVVALWLIVSVFFQSSLLSNASGNTVFSPLEALFSASSSAFFPVLFITVSFLFVWHAVVTNSFMICHMDKGQSGFSAGDVALLGASRLFKVFAALLITAILMFCALVLGVIFATLMPPIVAFFVMIIPISYVTLCITPLYAVIVRENAGPVEALSRCFELVTMHWWRVAGVYLVITVIVLPLALAPVVLLGILMAWGSTALFSLQTSPLFQTISSVFSVVHTFMLFFTYTLFYICGVFVYFSLVEEREAVGLLERIENIGVLPTHSERDSGR